MTARQLEDSGQMPRGLVKRALVRLAMQLLLALLAAVVLFVLASSASRWSGLMKQLSPFLYGLFVFPAMASYFYLWRLIQVGWNVRFRRPVPCEVRLVSQKSTGLDRGTVVFLTALGKEARFGRTTFTWTPSSFLARGNSYVYPGRYAVILAPGVPPLASTLRM